MTCMRSRCHLCCCKTWCAFKILFCVNMCMMCTCVYMCVCVWHCIVWRLEDSGCQFWPSTLFETGLVFFCVCKASWHISFQRVSRVCLPSCHRSIGITDPCYSIWCFHLFWGSELRFSCTHLSHFTHYLISLALMCIPLSKYIAYHVARL